MITNADMTIYNQKINPETKLTEYMRTQITGIHWYMEQKTSVDDKGLHSKDVYKIRIPEDAETGTKRYVTPEQYQAMEDVSGVWTIQNGDVFVKDLVDDSIKKASDIFSKYPECSGRVKSWSDNRFGGLSHAPGSTYSVDGIILCQSGNNYWLGYLSGTSTVAVDWKKLPTLMNNTVWVHDALQKLYIAASSETNYRLFLGVSDSAWRLSPAVSGQLQLGGANYKWGQIFATSSTISTSDREEKHDINSLEDSVKDFILGLNPVSYKFNDGTSGRTHFGMIAQDVEELMAHQGISSMDFAGFIKSPKIKTVTDEEGTVIEEKVIENEYLYGLRYEEFIAPIIKTIQLQQKEINALNERINKLEGGISWN